MTLSEIIAQARIELDDTEPDFLWTEPELINYVNDAQVQACRRSRLIIDSSSPEVCQIAFTAGSALYPLDERIISIKDVTNEKGNNLKGETVGWMNENISSWRKSEGEPSAVITDYETNALRLYPIPKVDGVINLRVVREPFNPLANPDDVPEIKSRYHLALIHWVKHRAYLKKDADTLDKNASAEALTLFEMEFGKARSAYNIEFDFYNLPYDNLDGSY
jgi:hypothetical protein